MDNRKPNGQFGPHNNGNPDGSNGKGGLHADIRRMGIAIFGEGPEAKAWSDVELLIAKNSNLRQALERHYAELRALTILAEAAHQQQARCSPSLYEWLESQPLAIVEDVCFQFQAYYSNRVEEYKMLRAALPRKYFNIDGSMIERPREPQTNEDLLEDALSETPLARHWKDD